MELANQITTNRKLPFEMLIVVKLVKIFHIYYGAERIIKTFIRACNIFLSYA
jgi:hypothetical protein